MPLDLVSGCQAEAIAPHVCLGLPAHLSVSFTLTELIFNSNIFNHSGVKPSVLLFYKF